jgi:hypothetical protein
VMDPETNKAEISKSTAAQLTLHARKLRPQLPRLPLSVIPLKEATTERIHEPVYDESKLNQSSPKETELVLGDDVLAFDSPWQVFEPLVDFKEDYPFTLACSRKTGSDLVAVRIMGRDDAVRVLSTLPTFNHVHIIKFHEAYLDTGTHFVVTEYSRHTLADLISVHLKFEERHIRDVVKSVCFKPQSSNP